MFIPLEPDRVSATRARTVQPVGTGRLPVTATARITPAPMAVMTSVPEQPSDGEV